MTRSWILPWGCALGACLASGCLFHRGAVPDQPAQQELAQSAPLPARPAPEPPPLSNYQVRPRISASGPPVPADPSVERVKLEVKPAVREPAEPEKPAAGTPSEPAPAKPEPALVAALRCYVEQHPEEVGRLLERYKTDDRELLGEMLRLVAGIGASDHKLPPEEVVATLKRLARSAASRDEVPLLLEKVCFCRKIESFGQFDPLPDGHTFQGGVGDRPGERVQVYAEVGYFSSAAVEGGYETVLASTLEIHDEQHRRVVTMNLGACTDRSSTPREDYFLNFQFHIPKSLPPGSYTLWVIVKDVTPHAAGPARPRVARRSLAFKVAAPR